MKRVLTTILASVFLASAGGAYDDFDSPEAWERARERKLEDMEEARERLREQRRERDRRWEEEERERHREQRDPRVR